MKLKTESDFVKDRPDVDDSLSYQERIERKDEHEDYLWEKIVDKIPWVIERATAEDDKRGIDAWAVSLKGNGPITPKSIQLKMRHYGGDDVLVEMVRPWPPKDLDDCWTGRDIKTQIDYYYSVSTTGSLRIFRAVALKKLAVEMCSQFVKKFKEDSTLKSFKLHEGEVKIITDPSEESTYGMGKVQKLVAFINPEVFKPTYVIQL